MIRQTYQFTLFFMAFSAVSHGAVKGNIGLGLLYESQSQESQSTNSSSESNNTKLNVDAGFAIDKGIYLGAKFIKHTTENGANITQDHSGYGICIGWFDPSGFEALYTTLLNSQFEYVNTSDSSLDYKLSGSSGGSILELGYKAKSGKLMVGPRISYITLQYDTLTTSSGRQEIRPATVETFIQPYFAVWFDF